MTSTKRNSANIKPGALYSMAGHLIRRCHQISVALFFEECGAFEITPQQYAVLSVLADNDGVDQITLAGLAALNRTTAGEIVDRMVSAGLLERRDNPLDRRVKNIFLTKPSLKLLGAMHEADEIAERSLRVEHARRDLARGEIVVERAADMVQDPDRCLELAGGVFP